MNTLQRAAQKGGRKKVPKGLAMLSKQRRRQIAKAGAAKRWAKKGRTA